MDRFLRILAGCTLTMAAVVGPIAIYSGNQDLDRATAQDSQAELSAAETEFNQENRVPVEVAPNGELLENHIGAGEVPASMVRDCQDPEPGEDLLCALILAHDSGRIEPGYYTDSELKRELQLSPEAVEDLEKG